MARERDAVIGAGIAGLALAYTLARRGRRVTVFDATVAPQGASVRNFGTLWPIGQPSGARRELATRSLAIWREVLEACGGWWSPCGSVHLAYEADELLVLEQFAQQAQSEGFACRMLTRDEALSVQPRIVVHGLRGALHSPHEMQVNSRAALRQIAAWLGERWGVAFESGTRVTSCHDRVVRSGGRQWAADRVWLATGDDLLTLYPDTFASLGLRRCKLQMMRTAPVAWPLGTILAAGLTLAHYDSFKDCPGLAALRAGLAERWRDQIRHGIHVLVSQHDERHLVLGDSHEYDEAITPFDKPAIDDLVLDYLRSFVDVEPITILERWHGIYVKHPALPYCVATPEAGVTALAGLGGHGMTLSFALAEQLVDDQLT